MQLRIEVQMGTAARLTEGAVLPRAARHLLSLVAAYGVPLLGGCSERSKPSASRLVAFEDARRRAAHALTRREIPDFNEALAEASSRSGRNAG